MPAASVHTDIWVKPELRLSCPDSSADRAAVSRKALDALCDELRSLLLLRGLFLSFSFFLARGREKKKRRKQKREKRIIRRSVGTDTCWNR